MSKNKIVLPFLRTPYNYDMNEASNECGAPDFGEDRTIQSEKDNSDINVIVKRFGLTGQMPPNPRIPQFGDYTGINDFQTAMNVVREAQEAFLSLPAEIRSRFGNDPQAYLEFCSNPENAEQMVKLGLAVPKEVDKIMEVKIADFPHSDKGENDEQRISKSGVDSSAAPSGEAGKGARGK